jgi:uncharacterized protein (DUF885 family)
MTIRNLLLATAALVIATPSTMAMAAPSAPAAEAQGPEDKKLLALFHESDEGSLARNPISGMFRGDMRYADHLGDYVSDAYFAKEKAAAQADMAALAKIDRTRLNATDQIAYDVFKWQTDMGLRGFAPDLLEIQLVRPVDHFFGFHTFYPGFASGEGAAPFKTLADYENNLKRHREYIAMIDAWIGRFRQGMKIGVVHPKLIVNNMIDQINLQLDQGVEGSTFYGPVKKFPEGISEADQARLKAEYSATIRDGIIPEIGRASCRERVS